MRVLRAKKDLVFLTSLGVLSVAGVWLLVRSTPFGIGLSWDSFTYITAARGLLEGIGLGRLSACGPIRPMTGYPPLYPLVLAAIESLGFSAVRAARVVGALSFGATILLSGLAVRELTRSAVAALLASILVLSSSILLLVYSWAWSEPLFMVTTLASALFLSLYFERGRPRMLMASAACLGLALLLRYAGLAFLASFGTAVILWTRLHPSDQHLRRWRLLGMGLAVVITPLIAWMIRNIVVAGTPTNRNFAWHPLGSETFRQLQQTVAGWFLPMRVLAQGQPYIAVADEPAWGTGVVALLGVALLSSLVLSWRKSRRIHRPDLVWILSSSIAIYLGFLAVSLMLFDSRIPLDNRILGPVYLYTLLLIVAGVLALWQRGPGFLRGVVLVACFVLLALAVVQADQTVRLLRQDGQGYVSRRWRSSQTIQALTERKPDLVYTNEIPAVYFGAGLNSCGVPTRDSLDDLQAMRERLQQAGAVLVLFGEITTEYATIDQLTEGLSPVLSVPGDGTIYEDRSAP